MALVFKGLDSCKKGWVLAILAQDSIALSYINNLSNIPYKNQLTVIDMPLDCPSSIGHYPRDCDRQAKKFLGKQHSSIFYAPLKNWLKHPLSTINQVCEHHKKPKLSIQSYHLFNKINELQTNKTQHYFIESHPECIFKKWYQANLPSKKTTKGFQIRKQLIIQKLKRYNLQELNRSIEIFYNQNKHYCTNDDIIDALALALLNYEFFSKKNYIHLSKSFIY